MLISRFLSSLNLCFVFRSALEKHCISTTMSANDCDPVNRVTFSGEFWPFWGQLVISKNWLKQKKNLLNMPKLKGPQSLAHTVFDTFFYKCLLPLPIHTLISFLKCCTFFGLSKHYKYLINNCTALKKTYVWMGCGNSA